LKILRLKRKGTKHFLSEDDKQRYSKAFKEQSQTKGFVSKISDQIVTNRGIIKLFRNSDN